MNPKDQPRTEKATSKILSEVGKVTISYPLDDSKHVQAFVKSHLYQMSESKVNRIAEIKKKYERLDAWTIYNERLQTIVKESLAGAGYPETGSALDKQVSKTIAKADDKNEEERKFLEKRQFIASYLSPFDIQEHLVNEMRDNPHKFKVTITYNPETKEVKK